MDVTIGNKYKLGRRIGEGSFGKVYLAKDSETNQEVAIKLEHVSTKKKRTLYFEYKCLKILQSDRIPKVMYYGHEGEYRTLVMELLGPSLEDLFQFCQKRFSLKTACLLAEQMLTSIEHIHENNLIHRDIKPTNLVMGLGAKSHILNIIDFGLAKQFRNPRTSKHISFTSDHHKDVIGTPLYASINSHLGMELSRRDDLESIVYALIYFVKGELPWSESNPPISKKSRLQEVKDIKLSTSIEELCHTLPSEFRTFMTYCQSLKFEDRPNYIFLHQLIKDLVRTQGFSSNFDFDWNTKRDLFSQQT